VILGKIITIIVATRSRFKAMMYQIRFRPEKLTALTLTFKLNFGGPTSKKEKRMEREGKNGGKR